MATIFLDIIYLGIFYPRSSLSDTVRFSAGMTILNLILKPISCFFVYQMYRERGGELLVHVGETTTCSQLPNSPPTSPGAGTAVSSSLLSLCLARPPGPAPGSQPCPLRQGFKVQGGAWCGLWAPGWKVYKFLVS